MKGMVHLGIVSQEISAMEIAESLNEILKSRLLIDTDSWGQDKYNRNFLERNVNMKARHLLRLYFEIEANFGISIPEKDIVSGDFNTISKISTIIHREIKNKTTR
ncbi:peptide maturation system acyl carrier-related protein [Paenibacillus jilunlii]|uniref:Acyl carrier protein n=1 Tax=Paenibacillus jilunlii TaxID=682956 RepID=A0A1G9V6A0_9BACL|nr:peptide maturation system acyl carrier-related protein [Paenibacillus jilunlii]KWX76887.1 hypothetical protein AML91_08830 [Paenibacillus jilunlii]SDM67435.1 acyl carrier protein [Paenibacillus jilunlii]